MSQTPTAPPDFAGLKLDAGCKPLWTAQQALASLQPRMPEKSCNWHGRPGLEQAASALAD